MKKTISILAIIAMLIFVLATSVNAASSLYNVSVSGNKTELHKGDQVTLTIDAGIPVQAATFAVNFDSTLLKYVNSFDSEAGTKTTGKVILTYTGTSDSTKQTFDVTFDVIGEPEKDVTVTVTPQLLAKDTTAESEETNLASVTWNGKIVKVAEITDPTPTPSTEATPTATPTSNAKKPTSYPKTGLNTAYIYVAGIVLVAICGAVIVNKRMK